MSHMPCTRCMQKVPLVRGEGSGNHYMCMHQSYHENLVPRTQAFSAKERAWVRGYSMLSLVLKPSLSWWSWRMRYLAYQVSWYDWYMCIPWLPGPSQCTRVPGDETTFVTWRTTRLGIQLTLFKPGWSHVLYWKSCYSLHINTAHGIILCGIR